MLMKYICSKCLINLAPVGPAGVESYDYELAKMIPKPITAIQNQR